MLPSRQLLFQGRPYAFQQDNAKPHTAAITTAWLRSWRVRVLNWPACSPDLSPIENIRRKIIKWKNCQRWPWTLQQLETYIRQEWGQIPTPKLQKLITSMPRCLQIVLKRRGDATHHGKHPPIPTILRPVVGIKFEMSFLSLNICYVIHVLLWIKYWLMWFKIILVFILFKFKICPKVSRNRVVI